MLQRYRKTQSEHEKNYYAEIMTERTCTLCQGRPLKSEVLIVPIGTKSSIDLTEMAIGGI
jgi:excinuclease ABC subunit A